MKKFVAFFILVPLAFVFLFCSPGAPDKDESGYEINKDSLMKRVEYLASEKMAGRAAGSEEFNLAATYAGDHFKNLGLLPAFGDSYLQKFEVEYNRIDSLSFSLETPEGWEKLEPGEDYTARGFTGSGDVEAEIVFAGYGISAPDKGYDDYAGIDVKGKIVAAFLRNPEWKPGTGEWPPAVPRAKAKTAADHGAAAIVFLPFPGKGNNRKPIGSVYSGDGKQDENFPQLAVSSEIAGLLLSGSGHTLATVKTEIDSLNKPFSLATGLQAKIVAEAAYKKDAETFNIAGLLEGSDPELKNEYLVVGAHLDHVGKQGSIYFPGANDNASGSAAVMEIASAFVNNNVKPARSVIFVLFSAEESGLYGSKHFVKECPVDTGSITAMMNFDCVGHGDSLRVGGLGHFPELYNLLKKTDSTNVGVLTSHSWGGGGADAEAFFRKGIPTLYFVSTNSYTFLHTIDDKPGTLNPPLLEDIAQLGYLTAREIAEGNYKREEPLKK